MLDVAREAKDAGIPIHVVALGTASGNLPGGGTATTDLDGLRQVAETSGGQFRTANTDELNAVYDELGSRLGAKDERRQVTQAAVGAGFLLLLASARLIPADSAPA